MALKQSRVLPIRSVVVSNRLSQCLPDPSSGSCSCAEVDVLGEDKELGTLSACGMRRHLDHLVFLDMIKKLFQLYIFTYIG